METFLSNYGLKWVGNGPSGELDVDTLMQDVNSSKPNYRYNLPSEIDIAIIERRIQELNIIAEKDSSRWVADGAIHKFKAPESVPIMLYKNGLILKGFPFKPYSSNQAQSLLSDILDGYFPYDLKHKYPDGVALRVVDKTSEMYKPGQKIGGVNDPSTGIMSKEEFLDKLPASVIKDGNIIPVREDIAQILQPEQTGTINIRTHVDDYLETPDGMKDAKAKKRITTLRIKTETGKKNLILKLWYNDSFSIISSIIERYREARSSCEIRSTFPARTFNSSESRSLEELELIPNYALALRVIS